MVEKLLTMVSRVFNSPRTPSRTEGFAEQPKKASALSIRNYVQAQGEDHE